MGAAMSKLGLLLRRPGGNQLLFGAPLSLLVLALGYWQRRRRRRVRRKMAAAADLVSSKEKKAPHFSQSTRSAQQRPKVKFAAKKRRALVLTLITLLCLESLAFRYMRGRVDRALVGVSMFFQAATLLTFLPWRAARLHRTRVSALAHSEFGMAMLLIPVVGRAPALLGLHASLALFTLASRRVLDGCMYSAADGNQILLSEGINWEWAFAAAGGVSVARLALAASPRFLIDK